MLGLPTPSTISGQVSPIPSPSVNTRNYHQNIHQRATHHRSEYHHQLPTIPMQAHGMLHGSQQIKMRPHYGSLPANTFQDNIFEDDDYSNSMTNMSQLRISRSLHRSRERTQNNYVGQPSISFAYGSNVYQQYAQPNPVNNTTMITQPSSHHSSNGWAGNVT